MIPHIMGELQLQLWDARTGFTRRQVKANIFVNANVNINVHVQVASQWKTNIISIPLIIKQVLATQEDTGLDLGITLASF